LPVCNVGSFGQNAPRPARGRSRGSKPRHCREQKIQWGGENRARLFARSDRSERVAAGASSPHKRSAMRGGGAAWRESRISLRSSGLPAARLARVDSYSQCQTAPSSSFLGGLLRPGLASLLSIRPRTRGAGSAVRRALK
jgi:hypothetical protein